MGFEETVADGQLLVASLIALAAGLVSFLSPCVLPLIPGYLAYVSGVAGSGREPSAAEPASAARAARRRMVLGSLLFVLGFTFVFVALLTFVGTIGVWLFEWEDTITRVMGVVIILLGLVFTGLFGGMQRTARLNLKPKIGLVGAPLLGAAFAIGWTPCIGPTLGVVMTLSLQGGSPGRAGTLGIAYSLGLGIPFVLAAFGFGWVATATSFFKRHIRAVNLIGGGMLMLIGLLMVTGVWGRIMFSLQAVMGDFGTIL